MFDMGLKRAIYRKKAFSILRRLFHIFHEFFTFLAVYHVKYYYQTMLDDVETCANIETFF